MKYRLRSPILIIIAICSVLLAGCEVCYTCRITADSKEYEEYRCGNKRNMENLVEQQENGGWNCTKEE